MAVVHRLDEELARGPLDIERAHAILAAQFRDNSPFRDLVVYDAGGHRLVNAAGDQRSFDANMRDYFAAMRDDPPASSGKAQAESVPSGLA